MTQQSTLLEMLGVETEEQGKAVLGKVADHIRTISNLTGTTDPSAAIECIAKKMAQTGVDGDASFKGKNYANLTNPERAALKKEDPTKFARMRAAFFEAGSPPLDTLGSLFRSSREAGA